MNENELNTSEQNYKDFGFGRNPQSELSGNIAGALKYFFSSLVYILFVCPFGFWASATNRLAGDRKNCRLDIIKSNSRWPYLSFCKRVFFEFAIDGFTFISWFLGVIVAIAAFFKGITSHYSFGSSAGLFFGILVATYYLPIAFALLRDIVTLMLLPVYKFLSWVSKPAQYLDIEMRKKGEK